MAVKIDERAWTNWQGVNRAIKGKEVVFFGVSDDWTGKTLRHTLITSFYFVYNSKTWQGTEYMGARIKSPEILRDNARSRYVIISSSAYESIYPQLIEYGLTPGDDFCIAPALNNLRVITEINTHDVTLLLSSPDHKIYSRLDQNNDVAGGLYTYNIRSHECIKVLDGTFHQIVETPDRYYIADEIRGICEISKDYELIDAFGVQNGDKPHGVAFCPERNLLFLARTGRDIISAFDAKTKKYKFDIRFSEKMVAAKKPGHWINDLFVKGGFLYASMFSQTGASREGVYDGGVIQISIDRPEERYVLMHDLWLPHSVCFFDDDICVLDSMRGYFYKTDKNVTGEFFGFIRGLAFDGSYYYVGQSETRYFDRLKGLRKNIGMSAGFYLFDEDTKAAKFFATPKIRQVRSLCVID